MDKVVEEVEKTKKEWDEATANTQEHIREIQEYGKSNIGGNEEQKFIAQIKWVGSGWFGFA